MKRVRVIEIENHLRDIAKMAQAEIDGAPRIDAQMVIEEVKHIVGVLGERNQK